MKETLTQKFIRLINEVIRRYGLPFTLKGYKDDTDNGGFLTLYYTKK